MAIPTLKQEDILSRLKQTANKDYHALYSSWYGGITTEPHLMMIPLDDHMVHRGDGIFEAIKVIHGNIYLLDEHLARLAQSADRISLKLPMSIREIKDTVIQTLSAANQTSAMIRLFVSRGPGNFSVNPYDSHQSQLYIAITSFTPVPDEKYLHGVKIGLSTVPVKMSWLAQTKSCNYLPNVLMKKEAVDRQLDFVVGTDTNQFITESATENVVIVDKNGILTHPEFEFILRGTTMMRMCELAQQHGIIVNARNFTAAEFDTAHEAMMVGTTLNVLPVVEFEGKPIGNGQPGPIATLLNKLICEDIAKSNP